MRTGWYEQRRTGPTFTIEIRGVKNALTKSDSEKRPQRTYSDFEEHNQSLSVGSDLKSAPKSKMPTECQLKNIIYSIRFLKDDHLIFFA
jgi:hypothetical protein